MKFLRLIPIFLCLLILHFCNKKEDTTTTQKPKTDTVAGDYQRGFESEGEIMDVNFDPTLIGAFSTQTEKKIELDSISYFFWRIQGFCQFKRRNSTFLWRKRQCLRLV